MRAWLATALLLTLASPAAALDGAPAPDFALRTMGGENLRLSELRGDVVLVNFWATWCGPCRQEMPALEELHRRYAPLGFTLLGVNIDDDRRRAEEMARALGVTFEVLFDEDKSVSREYRVNAMPMTLLLDREGNVRHVHYGYRRGDEQKYQAGIRELLRE